MNLRRRRGGIMSAYGPVGYGLGDTCTIQPNGARVCTPDVWQIPSINRQHWTDTQKQSVAARMQNAFGLPPFLNRDISLFNPPADSAPFIVTPNPFVNYPAPGAGPVTVISYTVPPGLLAVIYALSIVHVGGNPPDGTGNVIWRLLVNGAGVNGLNNLTSQVGTYAAPNLFTIAIIENDVIKVTVEVPAGQPAMPPGTTTAARFHGWTYPLVEATKMGPLSGIISSSLQQ
jgi:hypothetical protein